QALTFADHQARRFQRLLECAGRQINKEIEQQQVDYQRDNDVKDTLTYFHERKSFGRAHTAESVCQLIDDAGENEKQRDDYSDKQSAKNTKKSAERSSEAHNSLLPRAV